jgi:hypothetical protein
MKLFYIIIKVLQFFNYAVMCGLLIFQFKEGQLHFIDPTLQKDIVWFGISTTGVTALEKLHDLISKILD